MAQRLVGQGEVEERADTIEPDIWAGISFFHYYLSEVLQITSLPCLRTGDNHILSFAFAHWL